MSFLTVSHIEKHFGTHHALRDVSFTVQQGHVATLLGPSGCGKTTMLRAIAGLETIGTGRIELGGRVLSDGGSNHLAPERRGIGMVFQSYALWPHMTVGGNIALGLKLKRMNPADIAEQTRNVLTVVGLAGMADRYPSSMSGGQQQRVSLARALALEPSCLLFDEPLSNLDLVLRERMRFEIREILVRAGITAVYVTHDQSEAMVISDSLLVMDQGKIVQAGAPQEVYLRPATRFVAEFLGGANLLPLDRAGSDAGAGLYVGPAGIRLQGLPVKHLPEAGLIAFRPENLAIAEGQQGPNAFAATLVTSTFLGATTQCEFRIGGSALTAALPGYRHLAAGQIVQLWLDPSAVTVVADTPATVA
ncbi:ABC transporter ATP-binding protein [Acidisphaera sp. L21]|uniref:ABC transporter ATP-binding protein n=1 Tax=Acidisphaera sp. L21 TaxID=1641851 RepID=UPI00131C3F5F|nr:ABC transporter ATP-binding protein [Acidisphaera sp. L21]